MIEEVTEKITLLLQGRIPTAIDCSKIPDKRDQKFAEKINELIAFIEEIHACIVPLSRGDLESIQLQRKNFLASPFKELHSRLCHLTWQAKQVAKGDYNQRVDFMGDFSEAFNTMILALDQKEKLLKQEIEKLETALSHIKRLEGILPICSHCKKIRLDGTDPYEQENWLQLESYISERSDAQFSHSVCPDCMAKLYPWYKSKKK